MCQGGHPGGSRQGRRSGQRTWILRLTDNPKYWTRRRGRVAERSQFRAELPFVSWIEAGRASTSGDGSSGSAERTARRQNVKGAQAFRPSSGQILSSMNGGSKL